MSNYSVHNMADVKIHVQEFEAGGGTPAFNILKVVGTDAKGNEHTVDFYMADGRKVDCNLQEWL